MSKGKVEADIVKWRRQKGQSRGWKFIYLGRPFSQENAEFFSRFREARLRANELFEQGWDVIMLDITRRTEARP